MKKENSSRVRLDLLLVERGLYPSRARARAAIMAGRVKVEGRVYDKPGTTFLREAPIELILPDHPYVSRGGIKLETALSDLGLKVEGQVVLDVGASTGGFTDCLLKHGARTVYALDVGYGQLDYRLRNDARVVVLERFNVRYLKPDVLPVVPDLATVDVSFISIKLVLPVLRKAGLPAVLALIKPQFEAGRIEVSRGRGVIRSVKIHRSILRDLTGYAALQGYRTAGLTFSRLPGPKGNLEFFAYWKMAPEPVVDRPGDAALERVVAAAHRHFPG